MTQTDPAAERPLLTFALIAYNQEQFVAEALQGAFSQTYSPLQIILSDDCSTDATFSIMQEMAASYNGPHQVIVRRNTRNLGLAGHINRVMETVSGELIVVAAGDDVSIAERTERLFQAYCASERKALSLHSQAIAIDEFGTRGDLIDVNYHYEHFDLEHMAGRQISVIGNTHAWHRSLFDTFGPISDRVIQEDIVIPFRAALLGEVQTLREVLVMRRHHEGNVWLHPHKSDFQSMVAWQQARYEQLIENSIAIYETKLQDLATLERFDPARAPLITRLRPIVAKSLQESQMEKQFFQAAGWQRFHLLLRGARQGVPARRLSRWLTQYGFPTLYFAAAPLSRRLTNRVTRLLSSRSGKQPTTSSTANREP